MLIEYYAGIDRDVVQKMIAATQNMAIDRSGDNRFQSTQVFLFEEYAVLKMQNINVRNVSTEDPHLTHLKRLSQTLLELQAQKINVAPSLAFQSKNGNGYIVQEKAKGAELYDRHRMSNKDYILERVAFLANAPQAHYDKFVADTMQIIDTGILIDFVGKDNFFYHEEIGFQFIDLNAHLDYIYGLSDTKPQTQQLAAWNCFLPCYFDTVPKYQDTVSVVLPELTEAEWSSLKNCNNIIFEKCKNSMIKNGITKEMIRSIADNEKFIPQKQQLELSTSF